MSQFECARMQTRSGEAVMLKGMRIDGVLRGVLYEASVEQHFCNPTDKNIEVVYTFPLPWGAVLLGVNVKLGDKDLCGTVIAKQTAEAQYEEALAEGNAAIMLEKNVDRSYSLNLGNLAAGEDCIVTLRYAQPLQFEQHGLRLLIPTVIAPRYGDAIVDGGLQPHQAPEYAMNATYPFNIQLTLHGTLAQARIASPSHPISVASKTASEGVTMTVALARHGALDRDFVLVVDQLQHGSLAVSGPDLAAQGKVAVLASFCPRIQAQAKPDVALKILVDCSGSMQGDSIDAARRSLQAIVDQLGAHDRFSLSRFGSTVQHRSRSLWAVTEATQKAARRWITELDANLGGTEMEAAFNSTFALAKTGASDVLVLTDGEIYAIDSTIEAARKSGHRLFIVGIGSSAAESHLRRLAEATGGACDFVAPGEAVEPAVIRMFARLRSPRLSALTLSWPGEIRPEWASPLNPSVFDGDTINIFALLPALPAGKLQLFGTRLDNGEQEEIGNIDFSSIDNTGDGLSRVVTAQRLQLLEHGDTSMEQEAARLALDYSLITEQTNFLLVHQRAEAEKPADMPELHKVAQMIPAGWSGFGSVSSSYDMMGAGSIAPPLMSRAGGGSPAMLKKAALPAMPAVAAAAPAPAGAISMAKEQGRTRGRRLLAKATPDFYAAPYWSHSDDYTGLTPLGLSEWLKHTAADQWPTTYDALRHIGLGAWVVDWLELSIGMQDGLVAEEQSVIATFLYVIKQRIGGDATATPPGTAPSTPTVVQQLTGLLFGEKVTPASDTVATAGLFAPALLAAMEEALKNIRADHWPDQIFSLAA